MRETEREDEGGLLEKEEEGNTGSEGRKGCLKGQDKLEEWRGRKEGGRSGGKGVSMTEWKGEVDWGKARESIHSSLGCFVPCS